MELVFEVRDAIDGGCFGTLGHSVFTESGDEAVRRGLVQLRRVEVQFAAKGATSAHKRPQAPPSVDFSILER